MKALAHRSGQWLGAVVQRLALARPLAHALAHFLASVSVMTHVLCIYLCGCHDHEGMVITRQAIDQPKEG